MVTECLLLTDSPWEYEEVTRIGEFRITVANPREEGFSSEEVMGEWGEKMGVLVVQAGVLWGMNEPQAEKTRKLLRWAGDVPCVDVVFYAMASGVADPQRFEAWMIVKNVREEVERRHARYADLTDELYPKTVKICEGVAGDFLRLSEVEIKRLLGWRID